MDIKASEIKAILFDMDGVLVDSMPYFARTWKHIAAKLGIEITDRDIYLAEGEKASVSIKAFLDRAGISDPDGTKTNELLCEVNEYFDSLGPKPLFVENMQMVKVFKRSSYKVALVTGSILDIASKVLGNDNMELFDVVVTSESVERGKPHPEPYLKAAALLGLKPGECLVIENSIGGVESAKQAGCCVVGYTSSLGEEDLVKADYVYTYTEELFAILKLLGIDAPCTVLYFCQGCSNCCKGRGDVVLMDEDIDKLADFMEMERQDFIDSFCRLRQYRNGLSIRESTQTGDCIFLEAGKCCVYEARPEQCRGFPNTWRYDGFEHICNAKRVIM